MRTGVLKHPEVERVLAAKYVCSWTNIEEEATCGGSYAHEFTDKPGQCYTGDGEHNTQLAIFTPEGRLLDVMAGYQFPADLTKELTWAFAKVKPIVDRQNLSDEDRKAAIAKLYTDRLAANDGERHDLTYMTTHAMESWTKFSVEELVEGRGFGDHFFGRYGKEMPGDAIGKVPEWQQANVDEQRCQVITKDARQLKKLFANATDKERTRIKEKLAALETEYNELKGKNKQAAERMGLLPKK